jgi:thiol-disulfide isomerase/thioredoxin
MFARQVAYVLGVALFAASGLVLVLSNRNGELSADYQRLRVQTTLPHGGTIVPTFRTTTLQGHPVVVGELTDSAARQVLFVFNTTCPFCLATIPVWRRLADSLGRFKGVQVLAISLDPADSASRYVAENAIPYSVVTFPQPKLTRLYRATLVPQTVVLDWRGTVIYAKTGTLDPAALDALYAALARKPVL